MSDDYKEVYFGEYCKTCTHEKLPEEDEICNFCLDNPMNIESHKPVNWKKKGK